MSALNDDMIDLTMTPRADRDYFEWLTDQIEIHKNNPHTYRDVLERLHNTEFVWIVPNDDNRVQDGIDLRTEFHGEFRRKFQKGTSVLEVLIALSRRIAFTAGGDPRLWAWQLFENLGLHKASDPLTGQKSHRVEHILEALIWRTYGRDGQGGFFPLQRFLDDQTKVEIWQQMNAYVAEIQED